ncbi:sterol carrier family protein [Glutamicibacter sp. NPDC087344]|uniref:sterol carrier family protein n=1 Tax=Glutamicibacter sp. NPDC087344 TaxID=3363994 RepID=UPI0037F951F1
MAIKRRIDEAEGRSALRQWANSVQTETKLSRPALAMAVRFSLEELASRAEGNSVEVRVPPFGVTQCIPGPRHTRGTPPNVVEMPAELWLSLATGKLNWAKALQSGQLHASGLRADLSAHLPLIEYP